jgi:glucose-6-phosphate 1-dehydrogenase
LINQQSSFIKKQRERFYKMNSVSFILFGATGDLAHKKLLPAFYALLKHQRAHTRFLFIGTAKDTITADTLLQQVFAPTDPLYDELKKCFYYMPIDFKDEEGFKKLAYFIEEKETEHAMNGNRVAYLAVPAQLYCPMTRFLASSGIIKRPTDHMQGYHKVVYEKPFGWDLSSARAINQCIKEVFEEEQIYRIDHYLTKALVMSIGLARFSNIIFKPLWNRDYIDNIQIVFNETDTIEGRGAFYDAYGALKDVVQNHILQLLSLICMEPVESLEPTHVTLAKQEVLKVTQVVSGLLGQYEGYKKEIAVHPLSTTETFVVLQCSVDTPRWQGVPIYIKTGKALYKKSTNIFISFKPISKALVGLEGMFDPNVLTIQISPNSGFSLRLNTQKGADRSVVPIAMDFCYRCVFGPEEPHSYETLLYSVIAGDKSISVSSQEIEQAWKIIEDIEYLRLPLYEYKQGGPGPQAAALFARTQGFTWYL